ncbi:16S rRNA (guanine(966)-N(2))-methyltransferase RsmD [Parasphingopyxis sp. CP4]|uniref:16S rRNA (guanine(966)-N(2))-methyltransferase RsmD n=1 Tax=Parasphingopyxis sp. CP4 TaxID=2724527 RepID=UPI0015A3C291|nr:16S rRNA (guanine(966)-N(2))-methyltransferase RsmD [Parasphingopyxis sp. CP4]QLC21374.1 16S rRNA (guanine(966)-N(2))-methyltransferase RsmD [Parasphingopyxis sp. CP4]
MRIIGGEWRGRTIQAPPGDGTRPTTDRVREALFSMLASRLGSFEDLRVADLFAGSGALGLEALSRGAAHCTLVERDRGAVSALRTNIKSLGANADIITRPVEAIHAANNPCDLIFLDPPYGQGLVEATIPILTERGWIAPSAWLSIETEPGFETTLPGLTRDAMKTFGKSQLQLFRAT